MTATKTKKKPVKASADKNGVIDIGDVFTLAEAATYLRVSEENVIRMAREQNLPGRFVGDGWRFLKSALRDWLSTPMPVPSKEAIRSVIGSWKDDPYVEEELKEIYKRRGRPITEDEE